jgi:hypothetical protein
VKFAEFVKQLQDETADENETETNVSPGKTLT